MKSASTLADKRILVTRPQQQAGILTNLLRQHGACVTELPLIRIGPPSSWELFDSFFSSGTVYDWIIFASVNAVESTLERLRYLQKTEQLRQSKLAAIGPATKAALSNSGLETAFCPHSFVAESFIEEFPGYPSLASTKIFWPKTNIGRTLIADQLRQHGAHVDIGYCYSTQGPEDPDQCSFLLRQMLTENKLDVITITSSETARSLHNLLLPKTGERDTQIASLLQNVKLAVIGPETARTTKELLGRVDIQADEFTISGLVAALEKQTTD